MTNMPGRRGPGGAGPPGIRTLFLWCPDWPVIAAEIVTGVPASTPVAVLHANRVLACSPAARAEGVRRGQRRREAQGRSPQLTIVGYDPGRDARAFEPVLAAVEELAAGLEVIRPGACALAIRGPARYHGGEAEAAERIVEHVAQTCAVESQAGIADGVFAAGLAARSGRIVPAGGTPAFLADLPVAALDRPPLADLLRRLGIATLGDFAALPASDVLARFGFDAALAHRLAAGRDHRPLVIRRPPPDLVVTGDYLEDPLDRVDTAAFAARSLARLLAGRLTGHGLTCTRLGIEAVTAHGEQLHRTWRHDGPLTEAAIADRVRWQMEGWLSGTVRRAGTAPPGRPTAGIVQLRLLPAGLIAQAAHQPGLWGEPGEQRERAHRALSRAQGILGPDGVFSPVLGGGRGPADQVRLVPWGEERAPARPVAPPWPGRLPGPAPAVVPPAALPAAVYDTDGEPVTVTARLRMSAAPARLVIGDGTHAEITGWAGPWPVDERWWAPGEARRRARFQVCLADGTALLLALEAGRWSVEAVYD